MTEEKEAMQETPEGHTIPVPTREDVFRDLEKVAKPKPSQRKGGPEE
jgi:hypothetical protein